MCPCKEIQRLLDILRIEGRLKGSPGFSHALHLNFERLAPDRFHFDKQTLTFRYLLSSELSLAKHEKITSLSTFMAIVDDVSTWALILANPRHPRPGTSVSLQLESGPVTSLHAGTIVEITAEVAKIGRDLGFIHVEMKDLCSGELICFGSHVKYLSSSVLTNALLSPCGWPLLNLYSKTLSEPLPSTFRLQDLFDSLDFQSHTRALFTASDAHASATSIMHGGCQAILMEMVGGQVAKHELAAPAVNVEMAQVVYQSPAAERMEVVACLLSFNPPYVSLRIKLLRVEDAEVVSEGTFRFVNAFHTDFITASFQRYDSGMASWATPTTKHVKNVILYSSV